MNNEEPTTQPSDPGRVPAKEFAPHKERCTRWQQEGPYAVCISADPQYGVYIGTEHIVTGCDSEGLPILVKVETSAHDSARSFQSLPTGQRPTRG